MATRDARLRPGRVLVVTGDGEVLERVLRLAEAVGIEVNVAATPWAARRFYRAAGLVLAGADQAGACLRAGVPRCGEVVVVVAESGRRRSPAMAKRPLFVARLSGTVRVVTLPTHKQWLMARLREELPVG